MEKPVSEKLMNLRKLFSEYKIDAYVVPHSDPHQSEYLPETDERVKFISGFSGSNGICLVTQKEALLWTDSRYFLQAESELESGWSMRKMIKGEPTWFEWSTANISADSKIGYDPWLLPIDIVEKRKEYFQKNKLDFTPVQTNLVDKLWEGKPTNSKSEIFIHESEYTGRTAQDKIASIGKKLKAQECHSYFITHLEEIAWLLNLRGGDNENIPYFISYLLLSFEFDKEEVKWHGNLFTLEEKVTQNLKDYLKGINIHVKPYITIIEELGHINKKVLIDKTSCNAAVFGYITDKSVVHPGKSIIEHEKGVKNARELQGFRDCHIRDGAAIVSYLAWLDHALNVEKKTNISEYDGALHLKDIRKRHKWNMGQSFTTISSIGGNAAIVHYHPEKEKAAIINNTEIYLLDSGGQYLDGTTDTTRTTHFGIPNDEEKDAYTRVLFGNLDVERLIWPKNGTIHGGDIDILARRHLWMKGLDYGHGTGHGVGYFLNVHEGPHGISKFRTEPFLEGMVVTNEPGYYKEKAFGIRIENVLLIRSRLDEKSLGFENVTRVPYERKLIEKSLLTKNEIDHIDSYHAEVRAILTPVLKEHNDELALKWLHEKTQPL
jgi:Xaa-Pro aminopeptidase